MFNIKPGSSSNNNNNTTTSSSSSYNAMHHSSSSGGNSSNSSDINSSRGQRRNSRSPQMYSAGRFVYEQVSTLSINICIEKNLENKAQHKPNRQFHSQCGRNSRYKHPTIPNQFNVKNPSNLTENHSLCACTCERRRKRKQRQ